MNKIYLFLYVLIAVSMSACYEDKGNYDYHPINQISISRIEKEYQREKWQKLEIQPKLEFLLNETDGLKYRWEVDGKLVSEERDLNYAVAVDVADKPYKCRFTAMNSADSSKYFQEFDLKVVTPYESGIMVLSDQNGKAMLSFRSEGATTPEFQKWVYHAENNEYLEGRPLSLEQPDWYYDNHIFVATSKGNYRLDKQMLKLMKRYDGNTMLIKDPSFEMKFCIVADILDGEDWGCAIGSTGQVYLFREKNEYFASPSPKPIMLYKDETTSIDYNLSDKCLMTSGRFSGYFLGYDELGKRFLYFSKKSPQDPDQLNRVYVRTPEIGLPILAIGMWDYGKYASFFYDPQTGVAKAVASHNATFSGVKDDALVTLTEHHFTPTTILKFCDATGRAIYSSGSVIRQINMSNVKAASTVLSDKLPQDAEITCLKLSPDRKRLYVGILSTRTDEYKGDLYVLDAVTGAIIGEPYRGVGGKLVDVIEKW